jgi:hypothetical protein
LTLSPCPRRQDFRERHGGRPLVVRRENRRRDLRLYHDWGRGRRVFYSSATFDHELYEARRADSERLGRDSVCGDGYRDIGNVAMSARTSEGAAAGFVRWAADDDALEEYCGLSHVTCSLSLQRGLRGLGVCRVRFRERFELDRTFLARIGPRNRRH